MPQITQLRKIKEYTWAHDLNSHIYKQQSLFTSQT